MKLLQTVINATSRVISALIFMTDTAVLSESLRDVKLLVWALTAENVSHFGDK